MSKTKILALEPPNTAYGRFTSADGVVTVYVPRDRITAERANFLLDRAKEALLRGEWDE